MVAVMTRTPTSIAPRTQRSPSQQAVRRLRRKGGRWLGQRFGAVAIQALAASCQKTELNAQIREQAEREHSALILAFWHGRGVLASPFYRPGNTAALVSASEDGSMATAILQKLGYEIIRGSSSRGGVRALREMLVCLKGGKHVALTPDGPRGPMHSMSPGAAFMARATGRPVLPIGFGVDRARRLDTWDRYTLPRLGSRLVTCCGEPIHVPRDVSGDALGQYSSQIRTQIRAAERKAFSHLGLAPDWEGWVDEVEAQHTTEFAP